MEGIPQHHPESQENYKELVGKITLYRHGDTSYSNQYPDLTPKGKEKLESAGRSLKDEVDEENEDLIFLHSPSIRAKGSMAHLLHGMGKVEEAEENDVEQVARSFGPLRSVQRLDHDESAKMIAKHMAQFPEEERMEEFDRMYAIHEDFENSPHWESRSKVEGRASRLLRQTISMLLRNHNEDTSKTPHIVAISHFETLNNLAVRVFDLDVQKDPLYARGEQMTIEVRGNSKDKSKVLLNCGFRSHREAYLV